MPAISQTRLSSPAARVASAACCFAALTVPLALSSRSGHVGLRRSQVSQRQSPVRAASPATHRRFVVAAMASDSKEVSFGGGSGIAIPAPSGTADSVVIFLHGLGDTAHGWASAFPLPGLPNCKYILPTAATTPVTLNGGMPMPSWFDLFGLDDTAPDDEAGIKRAAERVLRIVEAEVSNGIPVERIVVGGFSQGGAVALATAYGHDQKFAGVLGMSTWLPNSIGKGKVSTAMKSSTVLMCHGESDTTVPLKWAKMSHAALTDMKVQVDLKTYPNMAHSASQEELSDVRRFVKDRLS